MRTSRIRPLRGAAVTLFSATFAVLMAACTSEPSATGDAGGGFSPPGPSPVSPPAATAASPRCPTPAFVAQRDRGRAGKVVHDVVLPVFSGGPASTEINRRVQLSLKNALGKAAHADAASIPLAMLGDGDIHVTGGRSPKVTVADERTVQVVLRLTVQQDGAMRPWVIINTIVLDVRDCRHPRPVRLEDVFAHLQPALREAAGSIREQAEQDPDLPGIDEDKGLGPEGPGWANWQADESGVSFYFPSFALDSATDHEFVVPWYTLSRFMNDDAKMLLMPPQDGPDQDEDSPDV